MKKKIFLVLLLLGFLLLPDFYVLSSKSMQTKKDKKALYHEVVVVLKLVQVYVMDKDGNPVMDLTKDDFILYDNGKLQKITDFEKHLLTRPEKKLVEELGETKLSPSLKTSSRMNRKFFLIIDTARNNRLGIVKSKKAAIHFIESKLQPTDEVSVLTLSALKGLILHEYLTKNHEKAKAAVQSIKALGGMGGISSSRFTVHISGRGGREGREDLEAEVLSDAETQNQARESMVSGYILDLKDLSKAFRNIPGYKNVILFSAGFPNYIMYKRISERRSWTDDGGLSLRTGYEDAAKELGSSSSPVYTVNTGPRGLTMDYASNQSLGRLSKFSGGKYYENVDDYEEIAEDIQNATGNYYVLGYYVDEKWDGKYNKIEVKVKRKKCKVHAQGGYFNPKPFSELSEFEKQLHLIDLALGENPYFQEPLNFSVAALPCSGRKKSNFVLLSEIPLDELEGVIGGKAELVTFIFDKDNNIVSSTKGEIDFSFMAKKKVYQYAISSLSPGRYECRVIIRNLKTGKAAVASSSVVVPEPIDSGIKLFPPVLLIPEREAIYLRASESPKRKRVSGLHSLMDIYPYLSNKHAPLIRDLEKGTSKLLAVVRCSVVDNQKHEVDISAYLIEHASGKKTPLSVSILSSDRKEETDILLLEIYFPEMKPGRYSLNLVAEESTAKSKSQVTSTFRIR